MITISPAFKKLINNYLLLLRKIKVNHDASPELSYRPAFNEFLNALQKDKGFTFDALTEPKRKNYGTPDYKIKKTENFLIGYIETKALDAKLIDYVVGLRKGSSPSPDFRPGVSHGPIRYGPFKTRYAAFRTGLERGSAKRLEL